MLAKRAKLPSEARFAAQKDGVKHYVSGSVEYAPDFLASHINPRRIDYYMEAATFIATNLLKCPMPRSLTLQLKKQLRSFCEVSSKFSLASDNELRLHVSSVQKTHCGPLNSCAVSERGSRSSPTFF